MRTPRRDRRQTVLLTGATGFVGSHLFPALVASGYRVQCLTRNKDRAERRWPDREWIEGDLGDWRRLQAALSGCRAAFYLVHSMADGEANFRQRDLDLARRFAAAASVAGVQRIIYLGSVAPRTRPSEHLRSRQEVGEMLRRGPVPAVELRASMIVGYPSVSWLIVRDLAAQLPAMVLPRWLRSRMQPVAIDDVVLALCRSLEVPLPTSAWFDLPGPEILSGRELLVETARLLGFRAPVIIQVPFPLPALSAQSVRTFTRADWSVARQLHIGLRSDLLARDDQFWTLIGHRDRVSFQEAAWRAIDEERVSQDGTAPREFAPSVLQRKTA